MPFPFHRSSKSKDVASPEVQKDNKSQKRPLMFAQDSSPNVNASTAPSTYEPSIAPTGQTLVPEDDARTLTDAETAREVAEEQDFVRPTTPPQGSNYNPWMSYRDLPRDHPVFAYPAEVREKMYAKGVDPVWKAEVDKGRYNKVYGEKAGKKGFVSRALTPPFPGDPDVADCCWTHTGQAAPPHWRQCRLLVFGHVSGMEQQVHRLRKVSNFQSKNQSS